MSRPWLEFWSKLHDELSERTTIHNWTKDHGEIGDNFDAVARGDYILVTLPNGNPRNIYLGEMQVVYDVWEEYLAGSVSRGEIAQLKGIVNAKYIISILHQFQSLMWTLERRECAPSWRY